MKRTARHLILAALAATLPVSQALAGPDLPRAAKPAEVAELLAKAPAGLEIVDLRPQAEFADYALPGSLNLDPGTALSDETLLSGQGPLLIVDKDGTTAFAVAGVLARKAKRPVIALSGGLAAWWAERELGMAVKEVPLEGGAAPAPAPAAAPAAKPAPAAPGTPPAPAAPQSPQAPQPPASKNAGC